MTLEHPEASQAAVAPLATPPPSVLTTTAAPPAETKRTPEQVYSDNYQKLIDYYRPSAEQMKELEDPESWVHLVQFANETRYSEDWIRKLVIQKPPGIRFIKAGGIYKIPRSEMKRFKLHGALDKPKIHAPKPILKASPEALAASKAPPPAPVIHQEEVIVPKKETAPAVKEAAPVATPAEPKKAERPLPPLPGEDEVKEKKAASPKNDPPKKKVIGWGLFGIEGE